MFEAASVQSPYLGLDPMDLVDLAREWESDGLLRNRARQNGCLTMWPSPATMGVASIKACSMNAKALEILAKWWLQLEPIYAKMIPIDKLRPEDWHSKAVRYNTLSYCCCAMIFG